MPIRCLIVDDEPLAVELVASYCARVPQLTVAATCASAVEASWVLRNQHVDLLFLDIKMPQLLGTDFLRSLLDPPKVILVTAYREYAFDGFELDIIDYLLKPLSFARFMKAIHKLQRLLPPVDEPDAAMRPFLYFRVDRESVKVFLDSLLYVESRREYALLHLAGGKRLLVREGISSLEEKLNHHRFVRIHRSFLVTADKVTAVAATQLRVGDQVLPVGRLYKDNLKRIVGFSGRS
ncbi:MAG TPA: LytTR family DNA-binding domain-containing protein [Dinghuibacter sp.]|uniref:LytR/AlgR family response regulator transcription factor n=1 Tax=Dinghuibacter sp. TaxID=2024697 RepID=UPI002BC5DBBC|nr:LytTR family DNA-binding domain-containing protein [Dinghuibacter sp.]HTJ11554.1 LytTR family DNA-binding domain-containing protein [Dinghuibacter sp.]